MQLALLPALMPQTIGSAISNPILVAAGGLVVVLAILLVFLMVMRSNGDARKMSSGFGYDAQQGPPGQPRAPISQPSRQPWGADAGYGAAAGQNPNMNGGQPAWGDQVGAGQWNDQAAPGAGWAGGGQPQPPAWGAGSSGNSWQDQSGWNGQAQPAAPPAWGGAANQPQPPAWGAAPAQQGGWGGAPAQAPAAGGWGAPAAMPPTGQEWGAPGGAPGGQPGYGAPGGGPLGQPGYGAPAGAPSMGYNARPAQRMGVLIVRQGKEPGRTFEMRKDRTTIGRSRESDIFLEDLAVSRLHTTIARDEHGRYIVHDESSANGTFVNGQRINEHVLEEGDEIQVGQTILAFVRR